MGDTQAEGDPDVARITATLTQAEGDLHSERVAADSLFHTDRTGQHQIPVISKSFFQASGTGSSTATLG